MLIIQILRINIYVLRYKLILNLKDYVENVLLNKLMLKN